MAPPSAGRPLQKATSDFSFRIPNTPTPTGNPDDQNQPTFTFASLHNASPAPAFFPPAAQSPESSISSSPSRSPFSSPTPAESTTQPPGPLFSFGSTAAPMPSSRRSQPHDTRANATTGSAPRAQSGQTAPLSGGTIAPSSSSTTIQPHNARAYIPAGGASNKSMFTGKLLFAPKSGSASLAPSFAASSTPSGSDVTNKPPVRVFGVTQAPLDSPLSDRMRSMNLTSAARDSRSGSTKASSTGLSDGTHLFRSASSSSPSLQVPQPSVAFAPYNIQDEQAPAHEYFSLRLQDAVLSARDAAENIKQALDQVAEENLQDQDSLRLRADAAKLSAWKGSSSRKFAVLGDSGQGKSSLINSLLHVPGIAQTSDAGSACTSVVTEYHRKKEGQQRPILIEVEYVSGAALKDLVKELAWSYRQLFLPDVQSAKSISDRDYAHCERESEQAWSALEAAFQHHDGFSREFLCDQSDGAQDRVNARLLAWARAIEWPSGLKTTASGSSTWLSTAEDADECCEKTQVFMQDRFWPFTKIIRVYLSSQILSGGIVLADLPGLQDTNLARVKATQDYLLQCDNILIVSKIARAITDQSLKSSLFSVLARHVPMEWEESGGKKLNIAVVCTGSEDINIKRATNEFCGQGKRISSETIERLEADVAAARESGDYKQKKAAKQILELALIAARSAHVTESIKNRYSSHTRGNLDVFCVGNSAYEKFCRKGNTELVKASGVPDLRRFCHSTMADAQLRDARHLVRSLLPSLLNSVDIWASSRLPHGAFDEMDKSNIHKHLTNIHSQVPTYVKQLYHELMESFEEQIVTLINHRENQWQESAAQSSKEWRTWRTDSYEAWCRRNGKNSTPTYRDVDWNASLIWKMRMELDFQWDIVEDEVAEVFGKLGDNLRLELTWLKDDTVMQASDTEQRRLLIGAIDALQVSWEYNLNLEMDKYARGIKHIRKLASESNATSYIVNEMIPYYREAVEYTGKGEGVLQKEIVGRHMEGQTLFPNIAIRMSSDIKALAKRAKGSVDLLVQQVMARLVHDARMALSEGELAGGAQNSVTWLKSVVDESKTIMQELATV